MTQIQTTCRMTFGWKYDRKSPSSQREATPHWERKELKLDAACRLRGFCYIPLIRMQKENWNRRWNPPCHKETQQRRHRMQWEEPCAESQLEETSCTREESNTMYGHNIDACESRQCRINESGKQRHEEQFADRGHNSLSLYNLVRLPIRVPNAKNFPEAKAAEDKGWGKFQNWSARHGSKERNKEEVIDVYFAVSKFRVGQEYAEVQRARRITW